MNFINRVGLETALPSVFEKERMQRTDKEKNTDKYIKRYEEKMKGAIFVDNDN